MKSQKLSWNCINCESANDMSSVYCEVCGYERYFSISEVNEMLEFQQESPTDAKKTQTNLKRASTENKKLRDKNKELVDEMQELRDFYNNYSDDAARMKTQTQTLQKMNLRLKIWLMISGFVILFLILLKVTIQIGV